MIPLPVRMTRDPSISLYRGDGRKGWKHCQILRSVSGLCGTKQSIKSKLADIYPDISVMRRRPGQFSKDLPTRKNHSTMNPRIWMYLFRLNKSHFYFGLEFSRQNLSVFEK